MAFSSNDSAFTVISKTGNLAKSDSFSCIPDVQEESTWRSSLDEGKFSGRPSMYSVTAHRTTTSTAYSSAATSSKTVRTFTSKKTVTKKVLTKTMSDKTDRKYTNKEKVDDQNLELASSSRHFNSLSNGAFFKSNYKDMDGDDFFRSASSRFSMRNLNDTSGWNFDLDEGASLFPDFFPKNDAATKLSFEATWRSVSPVKEIGLAKQAIKNCAWEEEEKGEAKDIVKSWMQFFGNANQDKV